VPPLAGGPVDDGGVLRHAVVPDHDSALLPLDTNLEVGAPGEVVVEEVEDGIGFLLLEANNVTSD